MQERIPKEFVTTIYSKDGPKEFVLLAGLLKLAHEDGLNQVQSKLLQFPSEANGQMAVAQVQVTTERGTYTATGDASPENVAKMVSRHVVRMAETRALARALRWATNVALTAFEELGGVEELEETVSNPPPSPSKSEPRPITQAQSQAIERLAHYLGWSHQHLKAELQSRFSAELGDLNRRQASRLIQTLQQQKQEALT